MPDVYEGDCPYIFVSYAHADDDAVLPLLDVLVAEGYRVWWDKGIELAEPFPDYIANHVHDCTCFVSIMSRASLRSNWCNDEVHYALELNKTILPVYLEDVELPRGLHMRLCYRQHLTRSKFDNDAAMYRELFRAKALDSCLTPEGARRRGAKARDPRPEVGVTRQATQAVEASTAQVSIVQPDVLRRGGNGAGSDDRAERRASVAVPDEPGGASSVVRRDKLADYSWAELKELSRMIAAAGSDEEGLTIAREYGLVDKDSKLQGDEKPFRLKNGRATSIRILGFRHDELAGGGKAGISFEFADVPRVLSMNPERINGGGWKGSRMRLWLSNYFLGQLPSDMRSAIALSRKRTNSKDKNTMRDPRSVTVTEDGLWLLSMSEVYGRLSSQSGNLPWLAATYDAEGDQYQLYTDQGVTTTNYDFCVKRGTASVWWLRSPHARDSEWFHSVGSDGNWLYDNADYELGVSPGFCF